MAEIVSGYPLLLVVACRPGYGMEWGDSSRPRAIPLRPLEPSSSEEMLKSVLRVKSLPDELAGLIHERTGGNPFFLEEICQALLEEGTLRVEGEQARLSGSLEALDLPNTVQAVIRTRLDRIDRNARETLRLASVVGREFTRSILERTLASSDGLHRTLQTLKSAGLIQQTRVAPDAAYRFKHALTQEVAYSSLLEHQRRDLHERVGAAIEMLHGGRIEEHLDRLAHHFSRAESWRKAVHYGIRLNEATATHRRTKESLLEGHALAILGDICLDTGEIGAATEHFERSLQIRQATGDRLGEGWMLQRLARIHTLQGTPDLALRCAGQASEIAIECGAQDLVEACERSRRMPGI